MRHEHKSTGMLCLKIGAKNKLKTFLFTHNVKTCTRNLSVLDLKILKKNKEDLN